jgi:hypothetical protein
MSKKRILPGLEGPVSHQVSRPDRVELGSGECGCVEHRTCADDEAQILLFEPSANREHWTRAFTGTHRGHDLSESCRG